MVEIELVGCLGVVVIVFDGLLLCVRGGCGMGGGVVWWWCGVLVVVLVGFLVGVGLF